MSKRVWNAAAPCGKHIVAAAGLALWLLATLQTPAQPSAKPSAELQHTSAAAISEAYAKKVRPLVARHCLSCHSTKLQKGSLDLERFASIADLRKDVKVWQNALEQVEAGEMPPKKRPKLEPEEKRQLTSWIREFLDHEARARSGDPGFVPLRRLSNAEYDNTIRDLTGIDLRPTREFPADGAAGEGFANAAEALADVSPALFGKYFAAAKEISEHAVLLPEGIRFSPAKTRRDWTDECTARLQRFYGDVAPADGKLNVLPYLAATVKHRDRLLSGVTSIAAAAEAEKLNAKYLGVLWRTLTDVTPSSTLDPIRARWRRAAPQEAPALATEIAARQAALWEAVRVSNYGRPVGAAWIDSPSRQAPRDPEVTASVPLRVSIAPEPGSSEVTLRLACGELLPAAPGARVVWRRPRFEEPGEPPLLLKDYQAFGKRFELDLPSVFADAAAYLAAAAEAARTGDIAGLAQQRSLHGPLLQRWMEILELEGTVAVTDAEKLGRAVDPIRLETMAEKFERAAGKAWLNGWRKPGAELPIAIANGSNAVEQIPGRVSAHGVAVHPTPEKFVAAVWRSPISGTISLTAHVVHAHPACGNGVAWWLEHRRGAKARVMAEGTIELGNQAKPPSRLVKVEQGDLFILAVDAKGGDHTCDLTEITLTLAETATPNRVWNLAADLADSILAGNPHADRHGHEGVWSFVLGPSRAVKAARSASVPPNSTLAKWREAAVDPKRSDEASELAKRIQRLLAGKRPEKLEDPDRRLYDQLAAVGGALFSGLNLADLGKPGPNVSKHGLPMGRFDSDGNLSADADSVIEVTVPAALLQGREFVVEGELQRPDPERAALFQALASPAEPNRCWDGKSPVVGVKGGPGHQRLRQEFDAFRAVFPLYLCFPNVIANDEVVSLKMFHREDGPLIQLLLDEDQKQRLDRLWEEHRFVSQQAAAEDAYLPQFIGFVTQDGTKEALAYFQSLRPSFRRRAEEFARQQTAAEPKHLETALAFAAEAFRRPLDQEQRADLLGFYQAQRRSGIAHEAAVRGMLSRILVSPAFLFRLEKAPPGAAAAPVDDWELAARLSYFLWASMPDLELRRLAAAGRLREPTVLAAQVERMLKDPRVRALAVEFGTQWIHVRGFDEFKEKNEKLFPTFDASLRKALYEEAILFFEDFFREDRPAAALLDADATFLNETLAKHYGIPGVVGPQWRRVEGVKKHGRGGLLGLAAVQAKQAGASRTSPILRGNWVVETLLGEKLPKPPPDVPKLPETEGGDEGLTMRKLVERHTSAPECMVCHQRIDPFGFALENYDAIGRRREADQNGQRMDARAKLRDGTEFEGLEGLRSYLLTQKKDVVIRLFCRRLAGYALGRSVALSDAQLLDDMVAALNQNEGRISAAVGALVRSPQFRMVRGGDFAE